MDFMVVALLIQFVIYTTLFIAIRIFLKRKTIKKKWLRFCGKVLLGLVGFFMVGSGGVMLASWPGSPIRNCVDRDACFRRLEKLRFVIIMYCNENDGELPVPEKWCDLLMRTDAELRENDFVCPADFKLECGYSFNENLRGAKLSELTEDTILLFEGGGSWNSTGGPNMLKFRHYSGRYSMILLKENPRMISLRDKDEFLDIEKYWKPSYQSEF